MDLPSRISTALVIPPYRTDGGSQDLPVGLDPVEAFLFALFGGLVFFRAPLAADGSFHLDEGTRVVSAAVTPSQGPVIRIDWRLDAQLQFPPHGLFTSFCLSTSGKRADRIPFSISL